MASKKKTKCNISKCLCNYATKAKNILEKYVSHILLLSIRLWIANIFFTSGKTKFANIDSAIFLFEYEYNVPIISPVLAAYSATFFELLCPIFLALGLLTRFATLPLIGMALIIQLFVFQNQEHFYWLFLLATLLVYGGGKLSIDNFLGKKK